MAIILKGKEISSILKDFLAWHVPPILIKNRSRDFKKESTMLGMIELMFRETRVEAMVST